MTDEPLKIITKKTCAVSATIDQDLYKVEYDAAGYITVWQEGKAIIQLKPDHFEDFAVLVAKANEAIEACGVSS